jgi:hypothetical protein
MSQIDLLWMPNLVIRPEYDGPYVKYLTDELETIYSEIDKDVASASKVLQGVLGELVLHGRTKFDWRSALDSLLLKDLEALAYSAKFSEHLYGFGAQWQQTSINAAYTQFWIRKSLDYPDLDFSYLNSKCHATGLFFDEDISPTKITHRMKSEVAASTAMILEMNTHLGFLESFDPSRVLSALDDSMLFPRYRYLSLEYFRRQILNQLGESASDHDLIHGFLEKCSAETSIGWSDFLMSEKLDDYMGTAKRSGRDSNIHSPLLATFAQVLADDAPINSGFMARMNTYADHLRAKPWDIPAFKMRDLSYDFGPGLTILESIAAISLLNSQNS